MHISITWITSATKPEYRFEETDNALLWRFEMKPKDGRPLDIGTIIFCPIIQIIDVYGITREDIILKTAVAI